MQTDTAFRCLSDEFLFETEAVLTSVRDLRKGISAGEKGKSRNSEEMSSPILGVSHQDVKGELLRLVDASSKESVPGSGWPRLSDGHYDKHWARLPTASRQHRTPSSTASRQTLRPRMDTPT
jgi:hypothetical protein